MRTIRRLLCAAPRAFESSTASATVSDSQPTPKPSSSTTPYDLLLAQVWSTYATDFHPGLSLASSSVAFGPFHSGRGLVAALPLKTNTLLYRAPVTAGCITTDTLWRGAAEKLNAVLGNGAKSGGGSATTTEADAIMHLLRRGVSYPAVAAAPTYQDIATIVKDCGCQDPHVAQQMHLAVWLALERCDQQSVHTAYLDSLPLMLGSPPEFPTEDDAVLRLHEHSMDDYHRLEFRTHRNTFGRMVSAVHAAWLARAEHLSRSNAAMKAALERSPGAAKALAHIEYGVPPRQVVYWAWRTVLRRHMTVPPPGLGGFDPRSTQKGRGDAKAAHDNSVGVTTLRSVQRAALPLWKSYDGLQRKVSSLLGFAETTATPSTDNDADATKAAAAKHLPGRQYSTADVSSRLGSGAALMDYVTSWALYGDMSQLVPALVPIVDRIDHGPVPNLIVDVVTKDDEPPMPLLTSSVDSSEKPKDASSGNSRSSKPEPKDYIAESRRARREAALFTRIDKTRLLSAGAYVEVRATDDVAVGDPLVMSYAASRATEPDTTATMAFAIYRYGFHPVI